MGHILDRGVIKSGGCKVEMERVRERELQGVGVRGSCQQDSHCLEPASVVGSRDDLIHRGHRDS